MKIFDFDSFGIYHEAHVTFGSIYSFEFISKLELSFIVSFSVSFPCALC